MPERRTPIRDRSTRRTLVVLGCAAVVLGGALIVDRSNSSSGEPPRTAEVDERASTTTIAPPPPTEPTPPPVGEVSDPDDLLVLVDQQRYLPDGYVPTDLTPTPVPFASGDVDGRQMLREEASEALVRLFASAEADGMPLLGVSGFRSPETQAQLFAEYAATDGEEAAERYSARPGHSEHQTGLAIDVVGIDAECPAERCFAERPEATWLADNAHRFGFIVRYPKDGEAVTGYLHEPWHLRYVGPSDAAEIHRAGITLEEHLGVR